MLQHPVHHWAALLRPLAILNNPDYFSAMPLKPGAPVGDTIREFQGGRTYARTAKRFGAAKAHKQAVAVAMQNRRKGKRGRSNA